MNLLKQASREHLREIQSDVGAVTHKTPIFFSTALSKIIGCKVFLKAELFQKTGSYKPRGMYWALKNLPSEMQQRGALTFSAGNAAQGLAYAGKLLGIPCTVVMPKTASPTKALATESYGAKVELYGTPQECLQYSLALAEREGLAFVSSYDDANLMLGHSSLGLEVLDEVPDAAAIWVGIGGGGMAGGLSLALNALGHTAKLIGVEPVGAAAMKESLSNEQPAALETVNTIADGLAAPTTGELCFDVVRNRISELVTVTDDEIIEALKLIFSRTKLFAEPAGAAAMAGLLQLKGTFNPNDKVVCVISGGNVDLDRVGQLLQ